jgi:hypothetical protein
MQKLRPDADLWFLENKVRATYKAEVFICAKYSKLLSDLAA